MGEITMTDFKSDKRPVGKVARDTFDRSPEGGKVLDVPEARSFGINPKPVVLEVPEVDAMGRRMGSQKFSDGE